MRSVSIPRTGARKPQPCAALGLCSAPRHRTHRGFRIREKSTTNRSRSSGATAGPDRETGTLRDRLSSHCGLFPYRRQAPPVLQSWNPTFRRDKRCAGELHRASKTSVEAMPHPGLLSPNERSDRAPCGCGGDGLSEVKASGLDAGAGSLLSLSRWLP